MKYWIFVFTIFLFHIVIIEQTLLGWFMFGLIFLFVYVKQVTMRKWLVIYTLSFLMLSLTLHFIFSTNQSYFLVIDQREKWAIIHNGFQSFYMEVNPSIKTYWGDILLIQGTFTPLRMTTYEGLFSFPSYLNQRGVENMITIDRIDIWFRFPFSVDTYIAQRLLSLHPEIRDFVSQLLWKRNIGDGALYDELIDIIQYSGLGFYLTNQWMDVMLKLKLTENQSRWIRLIFFLPYLLMNLRQFGMLRVYGIELLKLHPSRLKASHLKVIVISIQSWINPYMWIQSGTHVYLFYQIWMTFFIGLFPRLSSWQRWLSFVLASIIYGWFQEGLILQISSLWFLPLSWVHSILFPFWVLYLYGGGLIPGLNLVTIEWINILNFLSMFNGAVYGGEISRWMKIIITILCVLIGLSNWLKLSFYQSKLIGFLLGVILLQLSGFENMLRSSVYFINVGQGDATLIQSMGQTMLIDTGGVKSFDMARDVLIPFFRKQNIRYLNYLVITHPDFDHDGAMPSLLASYRVQKVIKDSFDTIKLGRFTIQNYQHFHSILQEDNERSLVLGIQDIDCQWLVMGDATDKTELLIQETYPNLKADILRIGHHGSNSSTSVEFLRQIRPKEVVISVGGGNRYGHPHPDVLQRIESFNIPIRRTDIEGTIRYQTCKM